MENENIINPVLNNMVVEGKLSGEKIKALIRLKEIVDRIVVTPYMAEEEVAKIEKKFGVKPDVLTWGDYFQSEVASQHFDLSDEDFVKIVDTVRFDLISSIMIFSEKPDWFFEEVARNGEKALSMPENERGIIEEEAIHLDILRSYYLEMNLRNCKISEEDKAWFMGFVENSRYAAV